MTHVKKLLMLFAFLGQFFALTAKVKVEKNINYTAVNDKFRQLDVFYQKDITKAKDVVVFIHGGSWSSGKKDIYWWLGRNLARKGVVTVNINYGLSPAYKFERMAEDCAQAVKWVKEHVNEYGGNPERIFLMGHSAGGHLAELINVDPVYFKQAGITNPVKGVILNDAFGLDMKEYITNAEKDNSYYDFLRTFSKDPVVWEKGSPLHYVENSKNAHLIFYGAKTYPAIQIQSERLNKLLVNAHVSSELHVIPKKKHVGMISQMVFGSNQLYGFILDFLKRN
ncbi:alpha/beta hydrolase [Pedobacter cryoconitis]|uniref:Acetyl esterase/lipase n=1 Tax=Pedobacter cryoconitis TaxID=188932 RepID=A0A327S8S9_9SPHI|nr:alpha/beta hydrolase [Pedobacter cryoconitis]RAJ22167.1 acetyl esterase/lipase [Pedobacter cryoconitis]